jgi:UDP-N-acetylglucosamine 2-epimerase
VTKVMTVVGTRPEIIRLSEVIKLLDQTVEHVLVHTGQNYDYTLNEIFFEELGLRAPDHYMGVDTSSLGAVLGGVLIKTEEVLLAEQPDALLVLGDTNSCLAAVMAKRMRIPVYHMEAGNRCFDENVPEETNRRLVDHVADFNLVYTEHARRNLLAEGLHPRRILKTGSPMKEVLAAHADAIAGSDALERLGLEPQGYLLVSAHREENVDNPDRLHLLLDSIEAAVRDTGRPALVSTHPRTRKRLDALDREVAGVTFHDPLGFLDYNWLQKNAYCVLSDSGTISEESSLLDFPAVTLRDSIERPEALDSAAILMTGLDAESVVEAVRFAVTDQDRASRVPEDYRIDDCSRRAVGFILSTHARYESWLGIRR